MTLPRAVQFARARSARGARGGSLIVYIDPWGLAHESRVQAPTAPRTSNVRLRTCVAYGTYVPLTYVYVRNVRLRMLCTGGARGSSRRIPTLFQRDSSHGPNCPDPHRNERN